MEAAHVKEVLHHIQLMAPSTLYKDAAPCQYNDHSLTTSSGVNAFTWRVVHCQKPTLSAVEILDLYGNVIATSHTVGSFSLPTKKQVADKTKVYTHKAAIERSILIRGTRGDWAILKSSLDRICERSEQCARQAWTIENCHFYC